jgi:RNA polymerase sigma-70 factor (ECF subfamily)
LFTIARRLSINRQRRRRPVADSEVLESVEADTLSPGQIAADRESRQRLWDLADEVLSEPQRTALWLYYVEDMSVVEVARVLGHSRGAVKTMLFRARRKLLAVLESAEMETGGKIAECTNG